MVIKKFTKENNSNITSCMQLKTIQTIKMKKHEFEWLVLRMQTGCLMVVWMMSEIFLVDFRKICQQMSKGCLKEF